jgi:hypothetical protein
VPVWRLYALPLLAGSRADVRLLQHTQRVAASRELPRGREFAGVGQDRILQGSTVAWRCGWQAGLEHGNVTRMALSPAEKQRRYRARQSALAQSSPEVIERALLLEAERAERGELSGDAAKIRACLSHPSRAGAGRRRRGRSAAVSDCR